MLNHVYILLTKACNLRCSHCSVDAGQPTKEELSKEEVFDLIDQIFEMMVPSITITGGEPTLVDYLPQLVEYIASKPIKTHLMTNGFKINKPYAELLVGNGLVHVNISLDGVKEITHDVFRGVKGSFKKSINAIKVFKELGIYVETTTVIHEGNCKEIPAIVNLGKTLKVDNMKFVPIIPYRRGEKCNYWTSLNCYVNNISNFLFAYDNIYNRLVKKELSKKLDKEKLFRCGAGTGVIAISPEGNVLPCNNLENIVLGNIRQKKLLDIYNNSEKLWEVFEAISINGSECENCEILDYCGGGCAMISNSYHGEYKKCDITRKPYILRLMNEQRGEK